MKAKETLIVDYYEFLRVLNKEIKTTDYDFGVYSWEDAFIVELLKWYDNKVFTIKDRKKKWGNGSKEKWEEYNSMQDSDDIAEKMAFLGI